MPKGSKASGDGRILQLNTVRVQFCPDEEPTDLQAQLRELAEEIASGLSKLGPVQSKELLGTFVSDLCLSVAEQEQRAIRRQRQSEGIAAAKERGVQFGRLRKPLPENFEECRRAWRDGQMSLREAAKACGMSHTSFRNAMMRMEQTGT